MRKINYLNNKDILKEIHKSKISFCSYSAPEYSEYDIIIRNLADIPKLLKGNVSEAKIARADRLTKLAQDAASVDGKKVKADTVAVDPAAIKDQDVIFRLMTWGHIPEAPPAPPKAPKGKKARGLVVDDISDIIETEYDIPVIDIPAPTKYLKVNFQPYQHFKMDDSGNLICVGKSHWVGDIESGHFSKDHGKITDKLALMYMKLCERYATRSNWRGYCVDDSTEALTQRGWLGIDQITKSDIILSYADGNLKWSKIKSIYRGEFDGKMHYLTTPSMDALVTPGHKFVTERGLIKAELLLNKDKVILIGNSMADDADPKHSDALVELIGWIATEGHLSKDITGKLTGPITIYQNPGPKADRIRNCLNILGFTFTEKTKKNNLSFYIYKKDAVALHHHLSLGSEKCLTMEFIISLTKNQRDILINTMIDGDGWRRGPNDEYASYTQKSKAHIDAFRILCTLSGYRSNIHNGDHISYGKTVNYYTLHIFSKKRNQILSENIDFHGGQRSNKQLKNIGRGKEYHPNEPTTYYCGMVWCPETEYGCFMARRNNMIYLTGNTYVDEMKSTALLQLSQIGLQFDESVSANPFAYYTMALQNSFTRVLNIEKRNQNIRDDILEMNSLTPSFSRQSSGTHASDGGNYEE